MMPEDLKRPCKTNQVMACIAYLDRRRILNVYSCDLAAPSMRYARIAAYLGDSYAASMQFNPQGCSDVDTIPLARPSMSLWIADNFS